jgi:putative transcriptional regulator
LLFGTDIGAKYNRAMQKIGIRPGMLSSEAGHA